jgi:tRNA(Ile)-lysidine synthase
VPAGRANTPITADEFAALMTLLGPFEPSPRLAAAVSGGADSMALAVLAHAWAQGRCGSLLALVVDHGLRPESAAEAALTIERLATFGIPAQLLPIDLRPGPALAERARAARYAALRAACAVQNIPHLLLGHHAADQAETVLMRRQSGSGPAGLAAMPALNEQTGLRLLRPLLDIPPVRLRVTLRAASIAWVEDPSNRDHRALRPRLRAGLDDPDGTGPAIAALWKAARAAGIVRAAQEAAIAETLAARAAIHSEGFALLSPGSIDPAALAALIQAIAGAAFPPPRTAVAALAAAPHPATLAGVRLLPAGRLGDGLLLVREAAAMGPPVAAQPGAVWDGRFRLEESAIQESAVQESAVQPGHATIGALGGDAARLRHWSPLPSAILQTLPALRHGNSLVAVPHLLYPDRPTNAAMRLVWSPRRPAAGAPFVSVRQPGGDVC